MNSGFFSLLSKNSVAAAFTIASEKKMIEKRRGNEMVEESVYLA